MIRRLLVALVALAMAVPALHAQVWRSLDVSRQLHDSAELHVNVQYGVGRFELRPASQPVLYSMQLRYDENAGTPLHAYDAGAGTLQIGLKSNGNRWTYHGSDDDNQSRMQLALAPTVPVDLSLTLGATEARIDLGGMTLRGVHIESGAADETVDFSAPNRTRMAEMSADVGAASFTMTNLANANAPSLRVNGGVGAVTLGFGGAWTGDMEADVQVSLGKVTLRVPQDVGVELNINRFLASFDNDGLVKRNGAYYSDNWDSAKYHLRLHVQTSFGGIEIQRTAPSSSE